MGVKLNGFTEYETCKLASVYPFKREQQSMIFLITYLPSGGDKSEYCRMLRFREAPCDSPNIMLAYGKKNAKRDACQI